MWMSRVNGQVKVEGVEYAEEVWWSGGRSACRKLESTQMGVGGDFGGLAMQEWQCRVSRVEEAGGVEGRDETIVW